MAINKSSGPVSAPQQPPAGWQQGVGPAFTQSEPTGPMLYEHQDGRYAIAPRPDLASFVTGDPGWTRLGRISIVVPVRPTSGTRPATGDRCDQVETHLVDLYQAIDQVRAITTAGRAYAENETDQFLMPNLFAGIEAILDLADGDTLDETIAAVRSLKPQDPAPPAQEGQAAKDGATLPQDSGASDVEHWGTEADKAALLQSCVQEVRAMLEGAEGLARKDTSWTDPDNDPLLRLITMASTKFECDLMPMIEASGKSGSGNQTEEATHE